MKPLHRLLNLCTAMFVAIAAVVALGAPGVAFADTYPAPTGFSAVAGNAKVDLSWTAPAMPTFPVSFNGTTYNYFQISPNNFITFTSTQVSTWSTSASAPAYPSVHFCSNDMSAQQVYYRIDNTVTPNEMRVRIEGNNDLTGTLGSPTIVTELVFYRDQSYFDLLLGANAGCTSGSLQGGSAYKAITNGSTALSTPAFAANTNWRITGAIATQNGNTATWKYSTSATVAASTMLADGFTAGINTNIDDKSVRMTPEISGSNVQYSSDGGSTWLSTALTTAVTTYSVTGLTNGNSYYFRVAGTSTPSTAIGGYSATVGPIVPQGPPLIISTLSATSGDGSATITWTPPGNAGSAITGYTVRTSTDGINWTVASPNAAANATTYTVTGLTNGTTYYYNVAAINAIGTGPWSSNQTVNVRTVPGAPTNVAASNGSLSSNATAVVTWTAPTNNGGNAISNYTVYYSSDSGATWSAGTATGSTSTSYTVGSLSGGSTYIFKVAAKNTVGLGSSSTASSPLTVRSLPGVPTGINGTAGVQSVALTWTAPANDGGSAITGYKVEWSANSGGSWNVATASTGSTNTSYTVTGLTGGWTTTFRVSTVTALGTGNISAVSSAYYPYDVPSAPATVTATAGNLQVSLAWTAGAANGSSITNYWYQYSTDGGTNWSSAVATNSVTSPKVITGLTAGTDYVFRMAAENVAGIGPWSATTATARVYTTTTAPTGVTATAGVGQATITWTAPSSDNGSAVSAYRVQYSINGGSTWASTAMTANNATSYTWTLSAGNTYVFQVAAMNAGGTSSYSAMSNSVTVYNVPTTPNAPTATAGRLQATVTWTGGSNNGSAYTNFWYQYSTDGGTTWSTGISMGVTASPFTVTGLTAGTSYKFKVAGENIAGIGTYSSSSVVVATPYDYAAAPTNVAGTPGATQVALTWTAGANNGSAITGYNVKYSSDGGTTWSAGTNTASTSASYTFTGLTNGTSYLFRVAAINAAGTGSYSADSAAYVPFGVPTAAGTPTGTVGTPGELTLTWTAAGANGSAITNYSISISSNNGTSYTATQLTGSTSTSYTLTGLTNGTSYKFKVAGVNAAGTGTYSAASATLIPLGPPAQVTGLSMVAGSSLVVVSWVAPSNNGSAITDYLVEYSSDGGTNWTTFNDGVSTTANATVTGLTNGTSYVFHVAAKNAIGTGPYSATSASIVPFTFASAPAAPTPTAGNAQVSLSWTAPANNGSAITNYYYQQSSDGGTTWGTAVSMASNGTSYTVTGLTNGTSYKFKIAAVNGMGTGSYSPASVAAVPATVPSAVGTVTPTAGNAQVALSWSAPAANGSAITDYAVQWSNDSGSTWTTFLDAISSATTATVTGLTNGTAYVFRVAAVNAMGTGAYSSASASSTPFTFADVPSALSATAGQLQASLTWGAPAENGSVITGYKYQYSSNSGLSWSTAASTGSASTSYTVTGLTANTAYIFRVAAVNAAGTGSYSTQSSSVMVYDVPSVPTVTGTAGLLQGNLSWTAPSGNGSAVTDYRYQISTDLGSTWTPAQSTGSTGTTFAVTSLNAGTTYKFRVAAVNAAGTGTFSAATSGVIPYDLPAAPGTVTGVAGGNRVTLSWTDGSSNYSTITDHKVQWSDDGGATWSTSVLTGQSSTGFVVTGLTAQQPYVFRAAAVNAGGQGPWSAPSSSVSPYGIPYAPGTPAGVSGNAQVSLTWTAADGNGTAITDYNVRYSSDGGSTWSAGTNTGSTSLSYTVTGLTNGTSYVFEVAGVNAGGAGVYSADSNAVIPATVPSAVGSVTTGPSDGLVDLSWSAPSNGGNAIVDYLVQYSSTSGSTWITFSDATSATTSVTVTGLVNGTAYVFRIAAVNNVGTGTWSSASSSATPRAVASAPLSLTALAGNAQVDLSWLVPATNGGMAITDYTVQWSSNAGSSWTPFAHTASTVPTSSVTGLTNGTAYLFRVAAVNSVGTGPWVTTASSFVPYTVAGAPTAVTPTVGDEQVTLSWTAPASNGGNAVSDYLVQYSSDSGASWATFTDGESTATSATVTGLTNGTAYIFRVKSVNLAGSGTASTATSAVTPRTVASAVQTVLTTPGNTQIVLTWTAPAWNGGSAVTDYTVQWSGDAGSNWTTFVDGVSTTTGATVTGLTNGSPYVFRVAAVNVAGTGAWSLVTTADIPYTVPDAPTSPGATVGNAQALLSWTSPAWNGGNAITDYTVQMSDNSGSTWSTWTHTVSTMTYATIPNLVNGTAYIFRVKAVNAAGAGSWSTTSSPVTPITTATAPSFTSSTPGNTQVALAWNAPSSNGGSTITDYKLSTSTDGGTTWGAGQSVGAVTSITMPGLTNGTEYVFRIAAVNGAGQGDWSAASAAATPRTIPDAPTGVAGTTGNAQIDIVWSVPAFNGGSAITDYAVQWSSDSGTNWNTFVDGVSTSRAATVTGLTNGTPYVFRVAAVNVAGTGTWSSASTAVTPQTVPAPPVIDSVTIGNAVLTVNFTAGDSGGTVITGYEYSTDNGATWRTRALGTTASPLVITTNSSDGTSALGNGVTYDLKLRAVNAAGVGSASAAFQATPLTVPTVAFGLVAVPGPSSATVSWTAPSFDGGTAITDYTVQYTADSGLTWVTFADGVSATESATVTGLGNGAAYAFRVSAVNSQGSGPWSVSSASITPRTVPGTPANLAVVPQNTQLSLTWTAPGAGGAVITDYVVEYSSDAGSTWTTYNDGFSSLASATITGLTNGTAYLVRVSATNIAGTGSAATSGSTTTPRTVPSAPTLGLPTLSNGATSVPFTLGSNGGNAVSSIDYSTDDGATWVTGASSTSPLVISGLANGTTYTVRIRAVNAAGAGARSAAVTAVPRTVPGAPAVSSVTPSNTGAVVVFTQPDNGGATVSDYQYSTDNGSTWLSAGTDVSPVTIAGLSNGTSYQVKLRAVNIAGTGAASTATTVVPFTSPGAPTITQVTASIGSVTVNLTAGITGGNAITNYEYSTDNGATWATRSPASTSSPLTITGLADGTRYNVRIRAVNAAGPGSPSDVAAVTTKGVPSAPTINSVTATHGMLSLSVTPGANGGDPITNYEYSTDNGATWVTRSPASTNTNLSITGLTDGYTYLVKVRAVNGVGSGAGSTTVPGKPHTIPSTPTLNSQVDGGNQSLTVTFTAGFDGGESLTNYEYSTDRGATWRARTDATGTTSPMLITVLSSDGTTRLTNGVTYEVELRAVNYLGQGDASTTVTGTPKTTPDAPSITRVTPDDVSATISFSPGGNGGSTITGYQYSTDGGTTWVPAGTMSSPFRITTQSTAGTPALVNGTTYQFKLRAVNAVGNGTATLAESLTPRTTPGSPTVSSATAGDRTITVAFTAGANGGATITSYDYSTDGGATWRTRAPGASMTSTPITVTTQSFDGLTRLVNGVSYDILIRAVNAAGAGRESITFSAIPSGVPSAPVISAIEGQDTRLSVTFTMGNSNGSAVTSNQYSVDGGSTWVTTASLSSPVLITGLTNGTYYPLQMRNVNANGNGSASFIAMGKPMTRPSAPVITATTPGNTSVGVTFTAPANGGDAITMYQYSTDNGTTWRDRTFGTIETNMGIPALSTDGATALANGTAYAVMVRAVNGAGAGAPSDVVRAVPYTVPVAPVISTITAGDAGGEVAYTLSGNGGSAVTSVDYSLNGGSTWSVTNSAANPLHIAGLANGTSYSVVIRAANAAGNGNMSNTRTVFPSGRPDIPQINNVVAGNGTLTYSFTPGFDSGAAITGYQYSVDGGATWLTAVLSPNQTKFTVSGLANGVVYNTRIRAVNANGQGVPSEVAIVKPYTVPEAPASASALAGTDNITVSYTAPAFDGGQQITGYEYSIDGGTTWVSTQSPTASNIVIPNLTNTTNYNVVLRAVSAAGPGSSVTVRAMAAPVAAAPVTPVVPTEIKGSAPAASLTETVSAPVTPTKAVKKKTKKKTTTSGSKTTSHSSTSSSTGTETPGGTNSQTGDPGTTADSTVPGSPVDTSNANGTAHGGQSDSGDSGVIPPLVALTAVLGGMWFAVVLWRRRRPDADTQG